MKALKFDNMGGIASALCVTHCLVISMVPSLLSNVQLFASYNEVMEWSFFAFAITFALVSAIFGFNIHKNFVLMSCFSLGILTLILGRCSEAFSLFEGGGILSIIGGFILFGSHLFSIRCCKVL